MTANRQFPSIHLQPCLMLWIGMSTNNRERACSPNYAVLNENEFCEPQHPLGIMLHKCGLRRSPTLSQMSEKCKEVC